MITGIAIENFKGIGERVELDLAPITLLFGPNSAGKSSILQSLHYAREVFLHRNLDPARTDAGGEFVDLGGFRSFVHGRDISNKVVLKLTAAVNMNRWEPNYRDYTLFLDLPEHFQKWLPTIHFAQPVYSTSAEISVRWDARWDMPVIDHYSAWINDRLVGRISRSSSAGGVPDYVLQNFNYDHPVLPPVLWDQTERVVFEEYGSSQYERETSVESPGEDSEERRRKRFEEFLQRERDQLGETPSWLDLARMHHGDSMQVFTYSGVPVALYELLPPQMEGSIPFNPTRVMPEFGQPNFLMEESSVVVSGAAQHYTRESLNAFAVYADALLSFPGAIVREWLRRFRYLGPLRKAHAAGEGAKAQSVSRWASGEGAWDRLQRADEALVAEVNHWLASPERLDSGYSLELRKHKELSLHSEIWLRLESDPPLNRDEILKWLRELQTHTRLAIVPSGSKLQLRPNDVGVGLSQVIPVLVTALDDKRHINAIEQPELHIHPRMQTELGDLFVCAAEQNGNRFIIETHSEHLILRLLRRIREMHDGELPEGHPGLRPDDVSVVYVERTPEGTRCSALKIDETGEFIDRWPDGFFAERAEELF